MATADRSDHIDVIWEWSAVASWMAEGWVPIGLRLGWAGCGVLRSDRYGRTDFNGESGWARSRKSSTSNKTRRSEFVRFITRQTSVAILNWVNYIKRSAYSLENPLQKGDNFWNTHLRSQTLQAPVDCIWDTPEPLLPRPILGHSGNVQPDCVCCRCTSPLHLLVVSSSRMSFGDGWKEANSHTRLTTSTRRVNDQRSNSGADRTRTPK